MKNINIFLLGAALCVVMASCQQDPGDLGIAQTNPQEHVIEGSSAISLTLSSETAGKTIDIDYWLSINPAACFVPVFDVTRSDVCPADAELSYRFEVASDATYSDARVVELVDNSPESAPGTLFAVAPAALQEAFVGLFSKFETNERVLYIRVAAFMTIATEGLSTGTCVRLGGADHSYLAGQTLTVRPHVIPGLVAGTPGADGKDLAGSMRLQRNVNKDAPAYEYGGFVMIRNPFTIEQIGDLDFKLGLAADGSLSASSSTQIPVPAEGAGFYYVLISSTDGQNFSYSATRLTSVGCIGDFNDWGGDVALTPNADGTVWSGEVDFVKAGGWKFRMNGDWAISLGENLTDLYPFAITNLDLTEAGVYSVVLDLSRLPYSARLTAR